MAPGSTKPQAKALPLHSKKLCEESGTFCFFQGDSSTSDVLLICGHRQEAGHSWASHRSQPD